MPELIINLTQHAATPEQIIAGVEDFPAEVRTKLSALLTFNAPPTPHDMRQRAYEIVDLTMENAPYLLRFQKRAWPTAVMLGGAPYFMPTLAKVLYKSGFAPRYSFSARESADAPQEDGSVVKTTIFRHVGWVAA